MQFGIYNTDIIKSLCVVFPDGGCERFLNRGFNRNGVTIKRNLQSRQRNSSIFEGLGFEHLFTYMDMKERIYMDNYCKRILKSLVVA